MTTNQNPGDPGHPDAHPHGRISGDTASDGLEKRTAAKPDYGRALQLDADELTNKLAKCYLSKPAFGT